MADSNQAALSPVLNGIAETIKQDGSRWKAAAQSVGALGGTVLKSFVQPIQNAMAFDAAMNGVRHAVSLNNPEQLKQIGQDVLDISSRLPVVASELATIIAEGGQAGIALDELERFAADAAQMGVAFGESARSAGRQIAQWRPAFGLTLRQTEALADQIALLGSESHVAMARLADIVTRADGASGQMNSAAVAALGDSLAMTGASNDEAVAAIRRVIATLTGKSLTARQKRAFQTLRLDPGKIAAEAASSGEQAMLDVFRALRAVNAAKRGQATRALFGDAGSALEPLLNDLSQLEDNFSRVGDAARYAGAMHKAYADNAGTPQNQLQQVKSDLVGISTRAGNALLPAVSDSLQQMMPLLNEIARFIKNNPEVVKVIAASAAGIAAIGGVAAITAVVSAAGPIGALLGSLVAAGGYLATHWNDIHRLLQANQQETGTSRAAQKVVDSWHFGQLTTTAPLVNNPFGFGQRHDAGQGSVGVIPGGMVNAMPSPLMDNVNAFRADVSAVSGVFPWARSDGKSAPVSDSSVSGGQDILTGAETLIRGEMVVSFENAPAGLRVSQGVTDSPGVRLTPQVGYSPYFMGNY